MYIIDKSFKRAPKSYIIQSLLATAVMAVVLYLVKGLTGGAIVADLGASTFIVFAMPHSITAQPRRLIGGHIIGLICGSVFYYACFASPLPHLLDNWEFMPVLASALTVGLLIFLMTTTDTEHPPAAGAALSIIRNGLTYEVVIFVLAFSIALSIARRLLLSRMNNLV